MKIFFDLDGTISDPSARHYRVYREVVSELKGRPLAQNKYWALKRAKTSWAHILADSGLSLDSLDEFLALFREKIENVDYLKLDTLLPGAVDIVKSLSMHQSCYLVSLRRNRENLIQEITWLGLDTYFKKVLTGHSESDGSDKKIEIISNELLPNERAIIIGDTEADIKTGKQLGLITIGVLSGLRDKTFIDAQKPDFVVNSLIELNNEEFKQVLN